MHRGATYPSLSNLIICTTERKYTMDKKKGGDLEKSLNDFWRFERRVRPKRCGRLKLGHH